MQTPVLTNERALLEKLQAGDEHAFRQVFNMYYRRLCVYAERFVIHQEEAEDIVDEAFLQLWNSKKLFEQMEHVKASLYVAVRHIGLNHRHSIIKSMERNYRYADQQEGKQTDQLLEITRVEALNELYTAVENLPEKARQIIVETYINGKSNQEVADQLGISLQTVKNQKLRALSLLRKRISREGFWMLVTGALATSPYYF